MTVPGPEMISRKQAKAWLAARDRVFMKATEDMRAALRAYSEAAAWITAFGNAELDDHGAKLFEHADLLAQAALGASA